MAFAAILILILIKASNLLLAFILACVGLLIAFIVCCIMGVVARQLQVRQHCSDMPYPSADERFSFFSTHGISSVTLTFWRLHLIMRGKLDMT